VNKRDLEERLINFAVLIIEISESMQSTRSAAHLSGQLIRSGTSPALNYGEAQSAESSKDFIHKIKIVLKELRETNVCLKIISKVNHNAKHEAIALGINESNELISIFVKSVVTAQKNLENKINKS
jgi:four helix bundle protein